MIKGTYTHLCCTAQGYQRRDIQNQGGEKKKKKGLVTDSEYCAKEQQDTQYLVEASKCQHKLVEVL